MNFQRLRVLRAPLGILKSRCRNDTFRQGSWSYQTRGLSLGQQNNLGIERIRNIGIIAHIDAGKTTTTERMLYYSGTTNRIGDVDDGSTVTDFLPAERARGITIQSAAVTFHWPPLEPSKPGILPKSQPLSAVSHEINLIDTPGHADFTFEVLRSLRVLDGAVCILDGVAGVEAQTESVWAQAGVHQIPRIIYINKLDRNGAAFGKTVKEILRKLQVWPLVCQIPWLKGNDKAFSGVGDVINLRALSWESDGDGSHISLSNLQQLEEQDSNFASELKKARVALVERLSELDDLLVDEFFSCNEDHLAISSSTLLKSLQTVIRQVPQTVAPVFAGASFRNIGVQPLLDGVVDLLPNPTQRPDPEVLVGNTSTRLSNLLTGDVPVDELGRGATKKTLEKQLGQFQACALAFKVVNDPKRGVLVYVRVYHGTLSKNTLLYNTSLGLGERAFRLLRMFASDSVDIDTINTGEIGVIVGLKHARTGDTLVSYAGMSPKTVPPSPFNSLQLKPISVPPPVFYTAIEPNSPSEEKPVQAALEILLREDPSLHITTDPESGQTLLSGMGELHLEIACDRLIKDLKAKATVGKIQIGHREAIAGSAEAESSIDREIGGVHEKAKISVSIEPVSDDADPISKDSTITINHKLTDNNILSIHYPKPEPSKASSRGMDHLPEHLSLESVVTAVGAGASAALARGPRFRFAVYSTHINVHLNPREQFLPETSTGSISLATRQAIEKSFQKANKASPSILLEPVMLATIMLREQDMGAVVHDLSSARGAQIISLDDDELGATDSNSTQNPAHWDLETVYAPPDPFAGNVTSERKDSDNRRRHILARVPLKEMVGYLNHLRSLTAGRGTFVMKFDRFEPMRGQRLKLAIADLGNV